MISFLGFGLTGAGPRLRPDMARLTAELQRRGATGPDSAVPFTPAGDRQMSALAASMRLGIVVEVRPGVYYYDGAAGERRKNPHLDCMTFFLFALGAMGVLFVLVVAFLLWTFMSA